MTRALQTDIHNFMQKAGSLGELGVAYVELWKHAKNLKANLSAELEINGRKTTFEVEHWRRMYWGAINSASHVLQSIEKNGIGPSQQDDLAMCGTIVEAILLRLKKKGLQ